MSEQREVPSMTITVEGSDELSWSAFTTEAEPLPATLAVTGKDSLAECLAAIGEAIRFHQEAPEYAPWRNKAGFERSLDRSIEQVRNGEAVSLDSFADQLGDPATDGGGPPDA